MENKISQNAQNYYAFITFVLLLFLKSIENVVSMIRDNASFSIAFSNLVGSNIISCNNHWFNLAVKHILEISPDIISKVNEIMRKIIISNNRRFATRKDTS